MKDQILDWRFFLAPEAGAEAKARRRNALHVAAQNWAAKHNYRFWNPIFRFLGL